MCPNESTCLLVPRADVQPPVVSLFHRRPQVTAVREAAARRVEEAEKKANAPKENKPVDEDLDMFG